MSGKPKPCRFSQAVGPPTSSSRASKQRFFGVLARFGVQYQPESLSSDDSDDALGQELPAMGSLPPLPVVGDVPPILFDSFLRETSTSSASSTLSTFFNSTVQVVSQPAAKRPLLAPPPPPPP
ncbi:MAG: hypothetical protein Q8P67_29270, partial [archaeon]|nr:hypothetical protein [archaeon]